MRKDDLIKIAEIVTVALACPFAILLPQYNTLINTSSQKKEEE